MAIAFGSFLHLKPARVVATLAALALGAGVTASAADEYQVHSFKKIKLTDQFYSEGANYGDFNHDGKMDVVSGPFWYEGPAFEKKHEYYPAKAFDPHNYSDNFFAFSHDMNGDGWDDIIIYGFPGKDASWFENPQGKEGPWVRHIVFDVVDNESPTWGDLTGDKKPEIIFHTGGVLGWAEPDWKEPAKKWTFHGLSPKGGYQKFTHGLGWGDVNGDGRMDLIEAHGWWEQPASLAGDPMWVKHDADLGGGGAQMYVYDVNGDGRADIITSLSAHGYGLAWFEQGADGKFTKHVIMNKEPSESPYGLKITEMHAIDLIDMDGDGIKDIVTGKRYWAHGPKGDPEAEAAPVLYWLKTVRRPDKSVDFVPYLIDDDSGIGVQVVAGDLNGDKLPDVVVGNKKGTFVFLHEVKTVDKAAWEAAQPKRLSP